MDARRKALLATYAALALLIVGLVAVLVAVGSGGARLQSVRVSASPPAPAAVKVAPAEKGRVHSGRYIGKLLTFTLPKGAGNLSDLSSGLTEEARFDVGGVALRVRTQPFQSQQSIQQFVLVTYGAEGAVTEATYGARACYLVHAQGADMTSLLAVCQAASQVLFVQAQTVTANAQAANALLARTADSADVSTDAQAVY